MSETNPIDETPAPSYTKTDENNFLARLEPFQKDNPKHPVIPVTKHPDLPTPPGPKPNGNSKPEHSRPQSTTSCGCLSHSFVAHALKADIVTALFAHIAAADTAAVSHLIRDQGLASPDCPTAEGETPLLAAIRARSAPTVRALIALGADPNLGGRPAPEAWDDAGRSHLQNAPKARGDKYQGRGGGAGGGEGGGITPLMLAAATGQLAIVKLLLDDFAADDSVVGPRGETALWLAAKAGHREVVAFLPTRRAGAWKRLRHSKEAARLKKAVVAAGQVGKCLVYTVPRGLVYDIPRAVGRFVWRRRWWIWGLVVRAVKGLPRFLGEVVWYVFTGMPRDILIVIVWISRAVLQACDVLWKAFVDGVKKVGGAVAYAAQRVVSVLHSFFVAVVSFMREVKLRDLGHDFLVALKALLVKLPGAVLNFVVQSPAAIKRAVKACFKNDWVKYLLSIALVFVWIVPWTLWKLLESLWVCLGRGVEELISLLNPKMVSSRNSRS